MSASASDEFASLRQRIERRLTELLPECIEGQSMLSDAVAHSVTAPGKRLRPLLAVATALDLGGDVDAAIDGGCAIEMIHAASLILDDMPSMDDAHMRRGRPATHVSYGEDVALLAVVAVLSRAFELVTETESLSAEQRLRSVRALTKATGSLGLVGGQFADLRGGRGPRSEADVARVNALKTGSLFHAAVEIGAIGSGAAPDVRAELEAFARELGLAFQLLDDLLDGGTSASAIGKDIGKDKGKSTIVSMIGRSSTGQEIERHMEKALGHVDAALGPGSRLAHLLAMIGQAARQEMRPAASGETGAEDEARRDAPAGMQ